MIVSGMYELWDECTLSGGGWCVKMGSGLHECMALGALRDEGNGYYVV